MELDYNEVYDFLYGRMMEHQKKIMYLRDREDGAQSEMQRQRYNDQIRFEVAQRFAIECLIRDFELKFDFNIGDDDE